MLLSSLLLLLSAAALHAVANVLMKQSRDKMAFVWWMIGVFCVLGSPALLQFSSVPPAAWRFVIASGMLEAIYFFTLTRAYTSGDLSLVYPIARGSAPLFLLIWAVLFLSERPSRFGVCGIFLVVVGLYLINLPSLAVWSRPLHAFRSAASRWALLTGILISTYSAIDKIGIQYFSPLVYLYLILLVSWVCMSIQWFFPVRRFYLLEEIRKAEGEKRSRFFSIIAAAMSGCIGYLFVLAALRLTPVSYVGPVREVSVVFGTIIGVRYLGEQGGSLRIAASALVALGIALIAIFG
ncbi:DMT family transporter [bacterium]|nr:DMT family transporter [bacterium]